MSRSTDLSDALHTLGLAAARWRAVVDSALDAIVCINGAGDITLFSHAAVRVFGYRAEEVLGRNVSILMPSPYREAHDRYLSDYRATGVAKAIGRVREVYGRRKSGEVFPIELSVAEASVDGEPSYTAVLRDVSAQRAAEGAVRDGEARFAAFMDHSPAVAFMKDHEGRYVYVNRTYEQVFATPLVEIQGKSDFELRGPGVAVDLRANDRATLAADSALEFTEMLPDAAGRPREWLVLKFPVPADQGRSFVGGMAVEITERRRAERRLSMQYAVSRALANAGTFGEAVPELLASIGEGLGLQMVELWMVDGAGAVLEWGGSWRVPGSLADLERTGRGATFARGEGFPGRVWASEAPTSIEDVMEDPDFKRMEAARGSRLRGFVGFPIRHGSTTLGVIGGFGRARLFADGDLPQLLESLGRQLGDFLQREHAEERLRELQRQAEERARLGDIGAIAARIVHDVGNPLAGLQMQAQLILRRVQREGAAGANLQKPAELIVSTVGHLQSLVANFKGFARQQRLDLESVELPALLGDIMELWQPIADDRRIVLRLEMPAELPTLRADSGKLRRVVDNLVKNAVEAVDHGPGDVVVRVVPAADTVRISVRDSGPGVPEGVEIFRLFETTKPTGSGLGLSIAREVALAHRGSIGYERLAPHGAAFHLDLPWHGPDA
ncbi:MAG: PAS domain S-box protein [Candidatus Binatia bacterium]